MAFSDNPDYNHLAMSPTTPLSFSAIAPLTETSPLTLPVDQECLIGLDLIGPDPEPCEVAVRDILVSFLQSTDPRFISHAVVKLDQLCAPTDDNEEVDTLLWYLWTIMFALSKALPSDSEGQDRLVQLLAALHKHQHRTVYVWAGYSRLWEDLPLLASLLREFWIDPAYEDGIPTPKEALEWRNYTSFAARCFEARILRCDNYAMWQLCSAFEDPLNLDSAAISCHLFAASEWILRSGKALLRLTSEILEEETKTETVTDLPDSRASKALIMEHDTGKLYGGSPKLCLPRWRFWKHRCAELGQGKNATAGITEPDEATIARVNQALTDELRDLLQQAVRHMDDVERAAGLLPLEVRPLDHSEGLESIALAPRVDLPPAGCHFLSAGTEV